MMAKKKAVASIGPNAYELVLQREVYVGKWEEVESATVTPDARGVVESPILDGYMERTRNEPGLRVIGRPVNIITETAVTEAAEGEDPTDA